MKFSYIILILTLHFCNVNEKKKQQNEIYYFYFENNNSTMNYIYSSKKNRKKYFYNIKKADYIYFDAVKNNNNFIVKKIKDTIGLNVKTYNWLNKFDNTSRNVFFNLKPHEKIYIIEKDSLNTGFKTIEVKFIDEIE